MKIKLSRLQIIVHIITGVLVAWLALDYFSGNLGVNPIQAITQRTGRLAIIYLALSLACTPMNTIFGFRQAITARRALGLYAFMFAGFHFFIFVGLDYAFNWQFIRIEVLEKRFIIVGALALTVLLALAVTSFRWWMKKLGKNWKRLHSLIYPASLIIVLHYAWAKKGDLFRLQGDVIGPLIFGLVIISLLILRVKVVRRSVSQWSRSIRQNFLSRRPEQTLG